MVDKKGENIISTIDQGLLKKWTEHSQELHLLKIHSRGASITPPAGWGLIFWTMSFYDPRKIFLMRDQKLIT